MRGQWPSGWEDPEDEELDTEVPDEATGARLSEVAAFLATVPAPVLPGAFESRIVAALAAESAARAADLTTDPAAEAPGPDRSRTLGPAPARARVRRFRGLRPAQVSGALVACLLFVGLGFAISLSHGASSSSSSAASAPQAVGNASASASGEGAKGFSSSTGSAAGPQFLAGSPAIVVIHSGITYQGSTLAGQVQSAIQVLHREVRTPAAAAVPSASSSSAAAPASSAPASAAASGTAGPESSAASASGGSVASVNALRECVLNLTGGVAPRLVDRATYQGTPAYVIATASRVWVVRQDCTAARPDLIVSVSLAS